MNYTMMYFIAIIFAFILGFVVATFIEVKYWSKMINYCHKLAKDRDKKLMTKILHYHLQMADMECNIREHPLEIMKNLGITYQHATPQTLGVCWWFWNCENIPEKLPPYLIEQELDPMECIGYGLSKEDAEKIRDYKK